MSSSVRAVPWRLRTRIHRIPLVRELQRRLVTLTLNGRSFVHLIDAGPAKGLRYPVTMPEDKQIWAGTYEARFTQAIADCIRPGAVCLDIGGFRGFVTGVMALAGARVVHVFEPHDANVAQIRRVLELNPELRIELHALALAAKDGVAEFTVMADSSMGKLSDVTFQTEARGVRSVTVPVRALDGMMKSGSIEAPQVIKIDVEGAEERVLIGSLDTLARHRPRLFIEAHSHALAGACSEILAGLGYRVLAMETGRAPDGSEPSVCHLDATAR